MGPCLYHGAVRTQTILVAAAMPLLFAACATAPAGTYFPDPRVPITQTVAHTLYRAALAAGDDPARYSFALVRAEEVQVYSDTAATFYVTEGLARLPLPVVEAEMARQVAHEVLGHAAQRRAASLSVTLGFAVLGIFFPGASLADLLINPLVVRAFSREQEREADAKAVEILQGMGHETPRRTLSLAFQALAAVNGRIPQPTGLFAAHPPLAERLAALEPLEPLPEPRAAAALPSDPEREGPLILRDASIRPSLRTLP